MTCFKRSMRNLLTIGSTVLLLLVSAVANAEDDLDVTMRMVTDDSALENSFVQELQLPEPVSGLDASGFGDGNPGQELAADALEVGRNAGDALAEQSRESRDALDLELPGESIDTSPELDSPDLENPGLDLPNLEDPDLPLVNEGNLTGGSL